MRKLEATTERVKMPEMMARSFRIEALVGKEWQTVYEDSNNILRFRDVKFAAPVSAKALRLVITSTWDAPKAHVFALDAI